MSGSTLSARFEIAARRFIIAACPLASLLPVAPAAAQMAPSPYPTTYLSVTSGWTGWSTGYGAGWNAEGSSGSILYSYSGPDLVGVRVNINELRNGPYGAVATQNVTNFGQFVFTPTVPSLQYTLTGAVHMILSGDVTSASSVSGTLTLEQIGGPVLATYGSSFARNLSTFASGDIYDSTSPLSGSQTGVLSSAFQYRLSWSFNANTAVNGDATSLVNVAPFEQSYFAINVTTVPAPGVAVPVLGAAALLSRRRRS